MSDALGNTIKVGDYVGWKQDIEISGTVVQIHNNGMLTVNVWDSIVGELVPTNVEARRTTIE